jgi:fructose transport system permease protein
MPRMFWLRCCGASVASLPFLLTVSKLIVAMVTVGQSQIVLTGGIDLTRGMVMALDSIVMMEFAVTMDVPPLFATVCGEGANTLFGLLNGMLITKIKLPTLFVMPRTLNVAAAGVRMAGLSLRFYRTSIGAGLVGQ